MVELAVVGSRAGSPGLPTQACDLSTDKGRKLFTAELLPSCVTPLFNNLDRSPSGRRPMSNPHLTKADSRHRRGTAARPSTHILPASSKAPTVRCGSQTTATLPGWASTTRTTGLKRAAFSRGLGSLWEACISARKTKVVFFPISTAQTGARHTASPAPRSLVSWRSRANFCGRFLHIHPPRDSPKCLLLAPHGTVWLFSSVH